jgi:hypothetical protein
MLEPPPQAPRRANMPIVPSVRRSVRMETAQANTALIDAAPKNGAQR